MRSNIYLWLDFPFKGSLYILLKRNSLFAVSTGLKETNEGNAGLKYLSSVPLLWQRLIWIFCQGHKVKQEPISMQRGVDRCAQRLQNQSWCHKYILKHNTTNSTLVTVHLKPAGILHYDAVICFVFSFWFFTLFIIFIWFILMFLPCVLLVCTASTLPCTLYRIIAHKKICRYHEHEWPHLNPL